MAPPPPTTMTEMAAVSTSLPRIYSQPLTIPPTTSSLTQRRLCVLVTCDHGHTKMHTMFFCIASSSGQVPISFPYPCLAHPPLDSR